MVAFFSLLKKKIKGVLITSMVQFCVLYFESYYLGRVFKISILIFTYYVLCLLYCLVV